MEPYYRKLYSLTLPDEATKKHFSIDWPDEKVRGDFGPIQASFAGTIDDPISNAWVDTFKALGYGINGDPFAGKAVGGFSSTTSSFNGKRSYAAPAYYIPASKHPNLHLVTRALVDRIVLDSTSKDIEVITKGVRLTVGDQL